MAAYSAESGSNSLVQAQQEAVPPVPLLDKNHENDRRSKNPHPPSPEESQAADGRTARRVGDSSATHARKHPEMSREEIRFLADVAARPLSTTVSRYQRLHLSRRRGNAIRQSLSAAGILEALSIATRSGQIVLYQLTDLARSICTSVGIDAGPAPRQSLEHRFWVSKTAQHFQDKGYVLTREHPIKGNGAIDLLAERPGERIAIEVETGKSDIKANLINVKTGEFDSVVLVATSPAAVAACQKAMDDTDCTDSTAIELLTWLDVS